MLVGELMPGSFRLFAIELQAATDKLLAPVL